MSIHSPRDRKGWRIPRKGTKSHKIYVMLKKGASNQEICDTIEGNRGTTRVLTWKIRHPETSNAYAVKYMRRWNS